MHECRIVMVINMMGIMKTIMDNIDIMDIKDFRQN